MANLSQQRRERMLAFLDRIREEHKADEDTLIAINEIENELTRKKYGLVWEEHTENVDIQMETKVPVFTEDKDLEILSAPGELYNFLLEGDNLHSLKLLEKTHHGRIDIIYIDPPYNRGGNDFIYNDNIVDKTDSYKHSKWISFMDRRLKAAWRILADTGCIFISIDDFENATLRILCDEIFGEANFLCTIAWQKRYSRENREAIGDAHEYILVYVKDKEWFKNNRHMVDVTGKEDVGVPLNQSIKSYLPREESILGKIMIHSQVLSDIFLKLKARLPGHGGHVTKLDTPMRRKKNCLVL